MDTSLETTNTKKRITEKSWYVPVVMFLSSYLMYVVAVLPILIKRVGITWGLPFIILSVALGKAAGALVQFYILYVYTFK